MRQNFNSLQKILPKLSGQKKVSNVCILKAATNEIQVCIPLHLNLEVRFICEQKERKSRFFDSLNALMQTSPGCML